MSDQLHSLVLFFLYFSRRFAGDGQGKTKDRWPQWLLRVTFRFSLPHRDRWAKRPFITGRVLTIGWLSNDRGRLYRIMTAHHAIRRRFDHHRAATAAASILFLSRRRSSDRKLDFLPIKDFFLFFKKKKTKQKLEMDRGGCGGIRWTTWNFRPVLRSGLDKKKKIIIKRHVPLQTWSWPFGHAAGVTYSLHYLYHQPPVCHHHRESKTSEAEKGKKALNVEKVYSYWLPALPTTSTWLLSSILCFKPVIVD